MKKSSLKIDSDKIDEIHRKDVELVILKINDLINNDLDRENYEDCARLKNSIPKFQAFLANGNFNEI